MGQINLGEARFEACPICRTNSTLTSFHGDDPYYYTYRVRYTSVQCARCGPYNILDTGKSLIEQAYGMNEAQAGSFAGNALPSRFEMAEHFFIAFAKAGLDKATSIISYVIRNRIKKTLVRPNDLFNILKSNSLFTPAELANNLIMFLGEKLIGPGDSFTCNPNNGNSVADVCGVIGTRINKGESDLAYIIRALKSEGKIETHSNDTGMFLTLPGWQEYEKLKRSVENSRKAFVAMKFYDATDTNTNYFFQTELLDEFLIPAVRETGYELSNPLSSDPKAGNLHARLEVEIRASRFVIAELSHHNNGAYWEAGFARGLGKPVIYMYNKRIGGRERPHFDVGSDYIVFWEEDEQKEAAEELKAVIRATLYGEAIQG